MAQSYTANYLAYANQIYPSDTIVVSTKYKNGVQKTLGKRVVYEHGDYVYEYPIGEWVEYYKNGQLWTETTYDRFGNMISWRSFDKLNGNPLYEYEALNIDTKASNLDEFLNPKKYFLIWSNDKIYRFSFKLCKNYLYSEGKKLNYKKIGDWTLYSPNGEIKKVKSY